MISPLYKFICTKVIPKHNGVITAGVTRCLQSSSSTSSTTGQHQQPQCNTGDGSLADQFSRAVSAKPRRSAVFRTGENDPRQHTRRHEGMFYSVDGVEFDRWMRPTVNTFMITMMEAFSENCCMIRRPSIEILEFMKLANYDLPAIRYILYGDRGNGKSTCLSHVLHACGKQDWLIINLAFGSSFSRFNKENVPSTYKQGRLDLPIDSAEWLASFRNMNFDLLTKLDLRTKQKKYVWNKRESSDIGTPLLELIEFGVTRANYASDVLGVVLKELRSDTESNQYKTLVCVDGVNGLWGPSNIKVVEEPINKHPSDNISEVVHFRKMLQNNWYNGAIVLTVDVNANSPDARGSYLPKYLLGQQGFEHLDPHIPVHVPEYSDKEGQSALSYYEERKWIQNPRCQTEMGKKELLTLASNNPFELYRLTAPR